MPRPRPSRRSSARRRRPARWAAAALTVALAATAVGESTTVVTLVTGDVVHVTSVGGKTSVAVDAADGGAVEAYELDGDTYVVPASVAPQVRAGTVDDQLFNVTRLIESGYADDATAELPVIVTYDGAAARSAATVATKAENPPARDATLPLPSIDGAAVEVAKADAADFWAAVQDDSGVDGVWLDGAVAATLDVSVPMVGAPRACRRASTTPARRSPCSTPAWTRATRTSPARSPSSRTSPAGPARSTGTATAPTSRHAVVRPSGGAGEYAVTVRHRKDAEHVSLRIHARGDGTRLEQEVIRAYRLN